MKRMLSFLIVTLLLLCLPALADTVTATGDVNLRSGPGLKYAVLDSISSGARLEYLGASSTDERGVEWYNVVYRGRTGWVSSVYAQLEADPEEKPIIPLGDLRDYVELSGYYLADLQQAAKKLSLTQFEIVISEAPNRYFNSSMAISGNEQCEHFEIYGAGYTLFGVALGMDGETAYQTLKAAGLSDSGYAATSDFFFFEHPSGPKSLVDADGFDSCVNVSLRDGVVVELDWSTYTG